MKYARYTDFIEQNAYTHIPLPYSKHVHHIQTSVCYNLYGRYIVHIIGFTLYDLYCSISLTLFCLRFYGLTSSE